MKYFLFLLITLVCADSANAALLGFLAYFITSIHFCYKALLLQIKRNDGDLTKQDFKNICMMVIPFLLFYISSFYMASNVSISYNEMRTLEMQGKGLYFGTLFGIFILPILIQIYFNLKLLLINMKEKILHHVDEITN